MEPEDLGCQCAAFGGTRIVKELNGLVYDRYVTSSKCFANLVKNFFIFNDFSLRRILFYLIFSTLLCENFSQISQSIIWLCGLAKTTFITCSLVIENKIVVLVFAEFVARFSQVMYEFAICRVICEKSNFVRFYGVGEKWLKTKDLPTNAFFANRLRCWMLCDCHIIHTVLSLVTGLMLGW